MLVVTPLAADVNPGLYLLVGDSITAGYDAETSSSRGYVPYLAALLGIPELSLVNTGVGGYTSNNGLQLFRENLAFYEPQYVLILFGTNDISAGMRVEDTIANLGMMIDAARTLGTIPILGTIIPRGGSHWVDTGNEKTVELRQAIAGLASGTQGTGLADHLGYFLANECPDLACGPDDEPFYVYGAKLELCCFYSDRLHPNQDGYWLLAQKWYESILDRGDSPPLAGDYAVPWVAGTDPIPDATGVNSATDIWIKISDFGTGVNQDSVYLSINGDPVPQSEITFGGTPENLEITHQPQVPFSTGATVNVRVGAQDYGNPPNTMETFEYSFQVTSGEGHDYGDINGSGRIDGLDLSIMGYAFGQTYGSSHYLAEADLNGDGIIDGDDLSILAAHFGEEF